MRTPSLFAAAAVLLHGAAVAAQPQAVSGSAFKDYRPMDEQPVAAWRELNDHVGRIGGWRAYAREAAAAQAPAPVPGAATSRPHHHHPHEHGARHAHPPASAASGGVR